MKPYTLTLSRWHKVTERLSRLCAEQATSAQQTFINTKVSGYFGTAQVEKLKSDAAQQFINLKQSFAMQDALTAIRQAIGEANARAGVTRELATLDTLSRRRHLLESILNAQQTDMVGVDEMSVLPAQIGHEGLYERNKSYAKIRVISPAMHLALQTESDTVRAKLYALTDRISDMNSATLTLDLADNVASAAGL